MGPVTEALASDCALQGFGSRVYNVGKPNQNQVLQPKPPGTIVLLGMHKNPNENNVFLVFWV